MIESKETPMNNPKIPPQLAKKPVQPYISDRSVVVTLGSLKKIVNLDMISPGNSFKSVP